MYYNFKLTQLFFGIRCKKSKTVLESQNGAMQCLIKNYFLVLKDATGFVVRHHIWIQNLQNCTAKSSLIKPDLRFLHLKYQFHVHTHTYTHTCMHAHTHTHTKKVKCQNYQINFKSIMLRIIHRKHNFKKRFYGSLWIMLQSYSNTPDFSSIGCIANIHVWKQTLKVKNQK